MTLKEFDLYQEMLKEDTKDVYSILKLFGYDIDNLDIAELKVAELEVSTMKLEDGKIKDIYIIGDRRFKSNLDLKTLKASQFIDFESYISNFKLQEVLSVFLIPQKRNKFGKWITPKYNDGYDIFDTQEYLYNNFPIGEANELSAFFFSQSNDWLKNMKVYLVKKEIAMTWNYLKTLIKEK